MKVKTFDLQDLVDVDKFFVSHSRVAVIEGPNSFIITDDDGVHGIYHKGTEDRYRTGVHKKTENGMEMIPSLLMDVTAENILKNCPNCEEKELTEFVRTFGSRIESNYNTLLNSIEEIGLDPADFPREKDIA